VEAALLAAEKGVPGRVYNLTDGEAVSKRRFIEAVADGPGGPPPRRRGAPWAGPGGGGPGGRGGPAPRAPQPPPATPGGREVPGADPGFRDRGGPPRAGLRPAAPLRRRPGGDAELVPAGPRGPPRAGRQRAAAPGAAQVWLNRPPLVSIRGKTEGRYSCQ